SETARSLDAQRVRELHQLGNGLALKLNDVEALLGGRRRCAARSRGCGRCFGLLFHVVLRLLGVDRRGDRRIYAASPCWGCGGSGHCAGRTAVLKVEGTRDSSCFRGLIASGVAYRGTALRRSRLGELAQGLGAFPALGPPGWSVHLDYRPTQKVSRFNSGRRSRAR